jgi:hypothetical protein
MKPKPKTRAVLDFTECTRYIEGKYNITTRDYCRSHLQFGEWCASKGEKVIDSRSDIKGAQTQYARFNAAIASGKVIERPYQDFWHFLCDTVNPSRGGTIELHEDLADGQEPWVKEILSLYLKEFGSGPYLNDW